MNGIADIHAAVEAAWTAAGLNEKFTAYWPSGHADVEVFGEQEAAPHQPWPYAVKELGPLRPLTRMSWTPGMKRVVEEATLAFHVHAQAANNMSARQVAYPLVDAVKVVFGGHPETPPSALSLATGGHLLTQLTGEYANNETLYKVDWVLEYRLLVDQPAAVSAA